MSWELSFFQGFIKRSQSWSHVYVPGTLRAHPCCDPCCDPCCESIRTRRRWWRRNYWHGSYIYFPEKGIGVEMSCQISEWFITKERWNGILTSWTWFWLEISEFIEGKKTMVVTGYIYELPIDKQTSNRLAMQKPTKNMWCQPTSDIPFLPEAHRKQGCAFIAKKRERAWSVMDWRLEHLTKSSWVTALWRVSQTKEVDNK